jgi:sugar lactone lactonase YvrE
MVAAMCAVMLMAAAAMAQTAHFTTQSVAVSGLSRPMGVAVDSNGMLYVADTNADAVRRYAPNGSGAYTSMGTIGGGLLAPYGVAVASTGDVFVMDNGIGVVHRYSPDGSGGYVQKTDIVSGIGSQGNLTVDGSSDVFIADFDNDAILRCTPDGSGGYNSPTTIITDNRPVGVAVDAAGNVYSASDPNWAVHRYAPNGSGGYTQLTDVINGFHPGGVAVDSTGVVYVSDVYHNEFYKFVPNSSGGYTQSVNLSSGLNTPAGVAVDGSGNIYVADTNNNHIVKLSQGSTLFPKANIGTSFTQTLSFTFDTAGMIAAPAVLTSGTAGMDFVDAGTGSCTTNGATHAYAAGDTCTVDVKFTPQLPGRRQGAAVLKTAGGATIASAYVYGVGVGPQAVFLPGTTSNLNSGSTHLSFPYQAAVDGAGNTYVSNPGSGQVVKVPAVGGSGTVVSTPGLTGVMRGIVVDGAGNLFIADSTNNRIYVVPASGTAGILTIDGLATGLTGPTALVFDGSGVLYIADSGNSRVVTVNLNLSSLGTGSPTGAGSVLATPGYNFSGSVFPALAVDSAGTVYVSDLNNNRVIKVTSGSQVSFVSTGSVTLYHPQGLATDAAGDLYIADANQRLVEISPAGVVAALPVPTLSATPTTMTVDQSGYLLIADFDNNRVLRTDVSAAANALTFAGTAAGTTSAPQTVILQNVGNADLSLPIPSTGNNPSISTGFSLGSSGATDCPLIGSTTSTPGTLASGVSCTLPVTFAPTIAGSVSGSLVLTDNHLNASPSTTQTIALSGTGLDPLTATTVTTLVILTANHPATPFTPVSGTGGSTPYSYSIHPALPSGLSIDASTGAISGTPAAINSSAIYSVTITDANSSTASADFTLEVIADTPTLVFAAIGSKTYGDAPFAVSATSASSGAVTYSVVSGPATVSGNTVTITGAGTVTLQASQAAAGNYNAVTTTTSFTVAKANPTLAFAAIPQKTFGDAPFAVSATSASDGAVTYTVASGPATVSGSTVTINGIGRVILTANQAATANYNSSFVVMGLDVLAATPTLAFAAIPAKTYGDAPFAVSASSASSGAVTYSVVTGPATVSGSTVTITGAGTVTLAASQAASGNYATATATTTLTVAAAAPTLSLGPIAAKTYGDSAFTVSASSVSTGAITYSVVTGPANVSGGLVSITGAGLLTLQASQLAAGNYAAATATTSVTIAPAALTVTASNVTRPYGAANPALTGTVAGARFSDSFTQTLTTAATISSPTGSYAIVPSVAGSALSNYTVSVVNGTLSVTQAGTSTTVALSATAANPNQTVTLLATVVSSTSGTPTGTVTFMDNGVALRSIAVSGGVATTNVLFASGSHSITASYSGDTNFLASTGAAGGGIAVPQLDFTLSGPANIAIRAGDPVVLNYTVTPTYGTYPGPVSFTVAGLPGDSSYVLSNTVLAANAGPQNVALMVKTSPIIAAAQRSRAPWSLALFLVPLLGARRLRRSTRGAGKVLFALAIIVLSAAGLGGLTGCGMGYFGAATKDYTVTVTATSGNVQRTSSLTLTMTRAVN